MGVIFDPAGWLSAREPRPVSAYNRTVSGMIILPNDRCWSAANWVVQALVDDARPHLAGFPELRGEFAECESSGLLCLDFEHAPPLETGAALAGLVERVIRDNGDKGPAHFHQPEWFPVYLKKLQELSALAAEVAQTPWTPPQAPRTAAGGRFTLGELVEGEPIYGLHHGYETHAQTRRVLITLSGRQIAPYPELWKSLELSVDGIAPLEYVGPVDREDGIDCLVEREPDGHRARLLAPVGDADAAHLGGQIARVLASAHERDVRVDMLHPDLVYVARREGTLRLCGIAPRSPRFAATACPTCIGIQTLQAWYGAPELARGDGSALEPTDVYSLCAVVFQLAHGAHPFGELPLVQQLMRCIQGELAPWTGAPALGEIVLRGMSADPTARPSATELAEALERFASDAT